MSDPRPTGGGGLDGLATWVARVCLAAQFRAVEVQGRANVGGAGPTLLVANHLNGLVDPLLMVHTLGYLPRFIAKAGLWRFAVLRPALDGLGLLPVVRRQDRARMHAPNADTFAQAQRALADGATVAIFPEGTAHDEPHLLPFRSGAARLALGARAEGATGLRIVPIGLVFDDKLALRTRALAVVGTPLDLDRWVQARGEPTVDDTDRRAVEDLTASLARALAEVVPTTTSARQAWSLGRAAAVAAEGSLQRLRAVPGPPAHDEPSLSASTTILRQLYRAPDSARAAVQRASDDYHVALEAVGIADRDLVSQERSGALVWRLVRTVGRGVVSAPVVLFGAAVNSIPYGLVRAATGLARKPAEQATVRVLVGVVTFPAAWLTVGWMVARRRGAWAGVAVTASAAASAYVTVLEFERVERLRRAWKGRSRRLGMRLSLAQLLAARQNLLDATAAALNEESGSQLREPSR